MCLIWGAFVHREFTGSYIPIYMYIYTLVHAHTHVYIHIHKHIHLYTYIHIHTYTHINTYAYLYILRRNKQMNGIKKKVHSKNTYTMTLIGNIRYLYWIILSNNNAEKNQFTAINNSLEDAVCIYF